MGTDTPVPHTRSSLPGPQGLPLLGAKANLLHLYLQPIPCLRQLYSTYGDIVVLTKNNPMLVFAFGPQHNFRLLSNPDLFHANTEKFLEKIPRGTAFTRILTSLPICFDELDAKLHGAPPTIEQLSQLPLLECVVKEGLRLFPPAMMGLRITMSTCELGGYELAAGTNILYSEFITHRLPELYAEPNRFQPERWLTLERSPCEYLPFSAGHHMCIASSFATQELKIVLAMMLPTGCATRLFLGAPRLLDYCRSPHAQSGGGSWLFGFIVGLAAGCT